MSGPVPDGCLADRDDQRPGPAPSSSTVGIGRDGGAGGVGSAVAGGTAVGATLLGSEGGAAGGAGGG